VVDNRSAGFYGIGGSFNFKSGDPSGTAAKMSQEKYGSEAMYMPPPEDFEEAFNEQPFVDRSALLRATLNSLAMNNVASVLNAKKHKKTLSPLDKDLDDDELEEEIKRLEDVFKEVDEELEKE
jgi:hypothetical protein